MFRQDVGKDWVAKLSVQGPLQKCGSDTHNRFNKDSKKAMMINFPRLNYKAMEEDLAMILFWL